MNSIQFMIQKMIEERQTGKRQLTLLAVCPNSGAVLEAAVKTARMQNFPLLFAATLNQVDRDGGYTGWTPAQFVAVIREVAAKYQWDGPIFPCLDHGGPWLKDAHTAQHLPLEETMREVKLSLSACLQAGYQLLHIDPTVDRTLPAGQIISVETVVDRTVEMIAYAEAERLRLGLAPVAYEVGTEEVHGGLVDLENLKAFLNLLKEKLAAQNLEEAWPAFVVAQVGTDLHTTYFNSAAAQDLYQIVMPLGSLIKCHYSDWVENPRDYPRTGVGGANVGPEFTSEEYLALQDLCQKEEDLCSYRRLNQRSNFMAVLENAVVESGRWKKWLQKSEIGSSFAALPENRRAWLAQTGSRYVWTNPSVVSARKILYENLSLVMEDPNAYVVDRIARAMDRYITAFHLFDSNSFFQSPG